MANLEGKLNSLIAGKKLAKEIQGMELKKQSLLTSIQNEIAALEHQITQEKTKIGELAYSLFQQSVQTMETLQGNFETIIALEKLIQEKHVQMQQLSSRYDEEIQLLRNLNGEPSIHTVAAAKCPGCGGAYTAGTDIFCSSCGYNLNAQ